MAKIIKVENVWILNAHEALENEKIAGEFEKVDAEKKVGLVRLISAIDKAFYEFEVRRNALIDKYGEKNENNELIKDEKTGLSVVGKDFWKDLAGMMKEIVEVPSIRSVTLSGLDLPMSFINMFEIVVVG